MKQQYNSTRPKISADIKREIEVEAGHQCSIKNCNEHTYLEIHHINLNREDNTIGNLILLCDKHHKMAHANKIDRKALKQYKELNIKSSKYNIVEHETIKDEPLARNSRRKFLIGLISITVGLTSITGVIIWQIMNTKFLSQKIKRFLFQYLPNGNQLVINKKSGTIHHKIICKNHLPKKNNVGNNIDFKKNVKFHKSKKLQILNKLTENISIEDSIEILLLATSNNPTSVHLYDKLIKLYGEIKRYGEIHLLLSNAEIIISNKIKMLDIKLIDCLNKTKEYKRYNKALAHIKLQQSKALDRARYKALNL